MTRGNPQIFWISAPLVVDICAPSPDSWSLPLPKPRWSHAWSSGEPMDILRACPEDSQDLESQWTKTYFQYTHTLIWVGSTLATHLQSTFFQAMLQRSWLHIFPIPLMGQPQEVHKSEELSIQFSVSPGSLGTTILCWSIASSLTRFLNASFFKLCWNEFRATWKEWLIAI